MPESVLVFYALFFTALVTAVFRPWVGVIAYTLFSLWFPHAVWPWIFRFSNFRVSYLIAASTLIGLIVAILTKKVDFSILKNRQNVFLFILWLCILISYFMSPYEKETGNVIAIRNPDYLINNMSKVILFYYVSVLLLDNKQKIHFYVMVVLFCAVFYVYWGNMEYFEGHLRGFYHTLIGPGWRRAGVISPYFDENAFAMLYVMCIPFLYFMGNYYENRFIKYFLWLNIPFAWHCIFLTGSRGGLVGLGVVTLFIMFRSKKRIFMVLIPLALIIAFVYQGGGYIKDRAGQALNMREDGSAQSRLNSWNAGMKMVIDHPVTGVGPGQFLTAYPDYSDTTPYVAHNTIIQFASESGALAGLIYLLLCYGILQNYRRQEKSGGDGVDPLFQAINESIAGSMVGFFVCSLFLNLATYEIFYYLLVLNAVNNHLIEQTVANQSHLEHQPEFVS